MSIYIYIKSKKSESKLSVFDELVKIGMNNIMPEKSITVYSKDAPWITVKLKELIRLRQAAFHSNKEGRNIKHSETQSIEKESSAKQDTMPRKSKIWKVLITGNGGRKLRNLVDLPRKILSTC